MRSEEDVNIIISNDPHVTPSGCREGVDCSCADFFQISNDVVSSRKNVVACLDLFFCQNRGFVNEKLFH